MKLLEGCIDLDKVPASHRERYYEEYLMGMRSIFDYANTFPEAIVDEAKLDQLFADYKEANREFFEDCLKDEFIMRHLPHYRTVEDIDWRTSVFSL